MSLGASEVTSADPATSANPATGVPAAELAAMTRAIDLARTPGVPLGPNPRVGCVLLDAGGATVAEGYHRGAGTAHAEADALATAGPRAAGTTAVVTLEPCAHTGRTGPCARALIAAGVRRVVYAVADPNPIAGGGAALLRAAGLEVVGGVGESAAAAVNREWLHVMRTGRPFVTAKAAVTLDGRIAAPDGTSQWITGPAARADGHRWRALSDAVVVGTGTALADDPTLTARDGEGRLLQDQPLRVVVGRHPVPATARVVGTDGRFMQISDHDPAAVLERLQRSGVQRIWLEGGGRLIGAWLAAGVVDRLVWYIAPAVLGAGASGVTVPGVSTIADITRFTVDGVERLGEDLRLVLYPLGGGADGRSTGGRP